MGNSSNNDKFTETTTTFPVTMNSWKLYLQDQGRSDFTIKAFLGDIRLLSRFLTPDKKIGEINTQDLTHFIEWLNNGRGKGIPCSPKSLARRITTIKSFFRWLHKYGQIKVDPAASLAQQSVISPMPLVLTNVELQMVIEGADKLRKQESPDARPYALLKLLIETGIKKSECLNLKHQHIISENHNYHLYVRYKDIKDRNKERKIDLTEEWYDAYQEYLAQYQPYEEIFPWSPRRLEYLLEDIGNSVGLNKHLSFSMCRWNCALLDWQSGKDPEWIRQKLGISKIQWREIKNKLALLAENEKKAKH
jgi:integrase/recombinase XerD